MKTTRSNSVKLLFFWSLRRLILLSILSGGLLCLSFPPHGDLHEQIQKISKQIEADPNNSELAALKLETRIGLYNEAIHKLPPNSRKVPAMLKLKENISIKLSFVNR